MSEIRTEAFDDHAVIHFDGLVVVVQRSYKDGALHIEVDSSEVSVKDAWPGAEVPRLSLAINDHGEQLDQNGNWVERTAYEPITVLDHMAAT